MQPPGDADRTLTALSRILMVGQTDDHNNKIRCRVDPGHWRTGAAWTRGAFRKGPVPWLVTPAATLP
jgi:hypothetical protein